MFVSFGVHVVAVLLLYAAPRAWFVREQPVQIPMTLSMGSPGEKTGGLNPAGSQPIERVAPPPKRPAPIPVVTPPKTEAIAIPIKQAKVPPRPAEPAPTSNPVQRPPTTGARVTPGTAAAATGSTAQQGTGLSVGGGAGGTTAQVDATFCCPAYAEEVLRRIEARWNRSQPEAGETIMVFEIRKDGSFTKPQIERSSGSTMLDLAAQAAFIDLKLLPLPQQYSGDTLKIHIVFPYKR